MAQIFISLGSNADREFHIRQALHELTAVFGTLQLSRLYESEAVGFCGDAFYNMVVGAYTQLSIAECVQVFKAIEDRYGRVRDASRYSGRTLDLDLLIYDAVICDSPAQLPRDEILENAYVLLPLAEIAPNLLHPTEQISYQTLWQQYKKSQKLWPIPFHFSAE
ncbi:MAG TPA: 2-amino-4-hydroxy-6-hydroxymethyldihydropteridine diphosphokinase [Rheinheimera sp.]|nr:2-amino-4-hydroxy-6-hydroxymethyldihydropteridine diphosphokinase [Rheinheimera sp.]